MMKKNVELLVVKYSHVVLQFFLLLFSVSFILLPVGFSFVVLGLRQVPRRVLKLWRKRGVFI